MGTGLVAVLLTLGLGANPPDVWTMRSRSLEIPIRVNEAKRADLQDLELHVSIDQGRTWTLAGKANPDQKKFIYQAQSDGLYWFAVCAIDRSGKREPPDLMSKPADLKVLIDTIHPPLQIVAADRVGEEIQVAWECSDSAADPMSLRLEYRAADQGPSAPWTPVTPINQALSGQSRFRPLTGGPITLRVQVTDGAGTPATAVKDLAGSPTAAPAPAPVFTAPGAAPPPAAPASQAIQQANSIAPSAPIPSPSISQLPNVASGQPAMATTPAADPPPPMPSAPVPPPVAPSPPVPAAMTPSETTPGLMPLAPAKPGAEAPPRPPAGGPAEFGSPAPPSGRGPGIEIECVRDRQVAIDFEVERKGPSGVKKIEVFITQDDGHTWYKWGPETFNTNPPLQLTLPKDEGTYGFRLVLYSGASLSEGPPRPGDRPDFSLIVDRTPPQVKLYSPTQDTSQPNALILRYEVSDTNLDPQSVKLEWSHRANGDWRAVSTSEARPSAQWPGVKECSWVLPPDITDSVYLRLRAADKAGNLNEFVTRDPVTVDLQKPTARVKKIIVAGQGRQ